MNIDELIGNLYVSQNGAEMKTKCICELKFMKDWYLFACQVASFFYASRMKKINKQIDS